MSSREYATTLTLTLDQLRKMRNAEQTVWDNGFVPSSPNYEGIIGGLGGVATVLGLAFAASTPAGVAAGVISVLTSLAQTGGKEALRDMYQTGFVGLNHPISFLENNSNYDMVEITLPFIEFNQSGNIIRFVSGNGVVKRVHAVGSGWIIM